MADNRAPATGTRKEPLVPIDHPDFRWTSGADVQSTWRKYGWTPPSEKRTQFYPDGKSRAGA